MNFPLLIWSLLIAVVGVAYFDSEYFHRKKFALHLHPETQYEHLLHTLQTFVATGAVGTLLTSNASGIRLWIGMAFFVASVVLTFVDSAEEIDSRKRFGGLTKLEYLCHLATEMMKGALVMALIVSKPTAAWGLASVPMETYPAYLVITGWLFMAVGIFSSVEHILLGRKAHAIAQ